MCPRGVNGKFIFTEAAEAGGRGGEGEGTDPRILIGGRVH